MRCTPLAVVIGLLCMSPIFAQSPTPEQKKATIAYLHSLQKENGGFAADKKPETPATLPATSSALRALKYFGAEPKSRVLCASFVMSCQKEGGYAASPEGMPDVRTTALGVMASMEIPIKTDPLDQLSYLEEHAKSFEEIRIAAAAFEGVKSISPNKPAKAEVWLAEMQRSRNSHGTYGPGKGTARDTAGTIVTILRLGGRVEHRDEVIKTLKAGQRDDGGWGKEGEKSDLETTYRVMRAFVMLKERPNVETCRAFVAKCRNDDGSYSVQPGQPGNVSATYFAGIILHWLDGL